MRLHNRQIKAAFWTDTELIRGLDLAGRLFYMGLIQLADDSGCLDDDVLAFKIHLFPADMAVTPDVLAEYRDQLVSMQKLIPYTSQGKTCLYLKNFHKHQTLKNPSPPVVPLPEWISWVIYKSNKKTGRYVVDGVDLQSSYEVLTDDLELSSNQNQNQNQNQNLRDISSPDGDSPADARTDSEADDDEPPAEGDQVDPVREVMDAYNRIFGDLWKQPLELTPDRRGKIKTRLKRYSPGDIIQAMEAIRASPFHCGDNPEGRVYATPEFICRNDGKIDEWMKKAPVRASKRGNARWNGAQPEEKDPWDNLELYMPRPKEEPNAEQSDTDRPPDA